MRFIQCGNRKHHYDISWVKPKPLMKRRHCFEVAERVDRYGEIITPLDEDGVRRLAREIRDSGEIEAVAVMLLFSYLNPTHELRLKEILAEEAPDLPVSLSYEVLLKWKAYERASTTCADACLKPVVSRQLRSMRARMSEIGLHNNLVIIKSDGGEMTLVTADMGGTSTDVSTITGGRESFTTAFEIEWGVPIQIPMIDIRTIGAGGGSIAWIDKDGMLRVGPHSAGAHPGPACYGHGGTLPTVTDAKLVLRRINPGNFLGGSMALDVAAAEPRAGGRQPGAGRAGARVPGRSRAAGLPRQPAGHPLARDARPGPELRARAGGHPPGLRRAQLGPALAGVPRCPRGPLRLFHPGRDHRDRQRPGHRRLDHAQDRQGGWCRARGRQARRGPCRRPP